jgi:flagellin-like hook-associated protein FlgL
LSSITTTQFNGQNFIDGTFHTLSFQAGYGNSQQLSIPVSTYGIVAVGTGTFHGQVSYALPGSNPDFTNAVDLNGDGTLDLVTSDRGSNDISVQLGNGSGTFKARATYAVGTQPSGITVGDLNGDGNLDIVTGDQSDNTASIALGNGDGTFKARVSYATEASPRA